MLLLLYPSTFLAFIHQWTDPWKKRAHHLILWFLNICLALPVWLFNAQTIVFLPLIYFWKIFLSYNCKRKPFPAVVFFKNKHSALQIQHCLRILHRLIPLRNQLWLVGKTLNWQKNLKFLLYIPLDACRFQGSRLTAQLWFSLYARLSMRFLKDEWDSVYQLRTSGQPPCCPHCPQHPE